MVRVTSRFTLSPLAFLVAAAFTVGLAGTYGCRAAGRPASGGGVGAVATEVQPPVDVTFTSLSWNISNVATAFSRSGTVNVQMKKPITFRVADVPAGSAYLLDVIGTPGIDGASTCAGGSEFFDVTPGGTTSLSVKLY